MNARIELRWLPEPQTEGLTMRVARMRSSPTLGSAVCRPG